jgi:hypothetical protein
MGDVGCVRVNEPAMVIDALIGTMRQLSVVETS